VQRRARASRPSLAATASNPAAKRSQATTVHARCIDARRLTVAARKPMNPSSSIVLGEARAATPPLPSVGDIVGGKYRLSRLLGEGGMGIVFQAEHLRLMQQVAIKWLRPDALAMPDALERFDREARAICRMRGPHVAHVMDVDADAHGRPYMVMELLRGRDLEAELQARGALPVAEAVDWVLQACAAIAEAHAEGIVHRDLKPSNLFLAEEPGGRVVKVLDFGISKLARDEPAVTQPAVTLGTPMYMSPEQVRSSRDVDARADIWSLGVILYELVTGSPPFLGTTTAAIAAIVADATPRPRDTRPAVPEGLELVIMTALAKHPDDRFPSAEALAAALVPFASAEGIAGPFSLRPSREAFAVASSAMARVPSGPRASDATELLRLPTSRTTRRVRREGRPWTPGKTFVGTLLVGLAVAGGAALGTHHSFSGDRPPPASTSPRPTAAIEAARSAATIAATAPPTAESPPFVPGESLPVAPTLAHARELTVAARPRAATQPGVPPATAPLAAPASPSAQRARSAPTHGPLDRPLYL
jgi:serine/threonine-protein kinase